MNEEKLIEDTILLLSPGLLRSGDALNGEGELLEDDDYLFLTKKYKGVLAHQIHELYKKYTHLKGNEKLRGRLGSYLTDMGHFLTSDELDVLMGFIKSTERWKK